MSGLTSIYVSLTSLLSFSKALDVIGDNVANLNTVGFKGSDLLFFDIPNDPQGRNDLGPNNGGNPAGFGASVTTGGRRFLAGEIRETGTATHMAIRGQGFFVLETDNGLVYTRAGQFDLDESGRLIDPTTGGRLQANASGSVGDLVIDLDKTNPPSPTTGISFSGNLSTGDDAHDISSLEVFDADGTKRELSLSFTNNGSTTSGSWTVTVEDEDGVELLDGEIRFQGAGFPSPGFSTLDLTVVAASGETSSIMLDFGTPGSLDGATSFSGGTTSTLQAEVDDGYGIGRLTNFAFDPEGVVTLTYSNGQTEVGQRVALASVSDPQQLVSVDGVYFSGGDASIGRGVPGEGGLGSLVPRSLELANIELAREFADIIILQRGYQASSQVMNVSSQMIEDVYNSLSGRQG